MLRSSCVLALAALACAPAARADFLVNGGFESFAIPAGSYAIVPNDGGWIGEPDVEVQNHVAGSPFEGQQFVELDTDRNSAMYQDFATVAGNAYHVHFEYSPRPGIPAASNGIEFLWNGFVVASIALDGIGHPDTVWSAWDFTTYAGGAASRVEFRATGTSDSFGGYLDDVVVTAAAPEPATVTLLFVGLAAAVGLATRRRRTMPPSSAV